MIEISVATKQDNGYKKKIQGIELRVQLQGVPYFFPLRSWAEQLLSRQIGLLLVIDFFLPRNEIHFRIWDGIVALLPFPEGRK